jgi:hypothetical protein
LTTSHPIAAHTSPPRLNIPCSEDIIGLGSSFSTATPLVFIATSIMPVHAPKRIKAGINVHKLEVKLRSAK